MGLKEKSYKFFTLIPHLALLWDMRRHQRCKPLEGLEIEIKTKNEKIYALLLDIGIGGMRIVSTDKRIEDSETISLSVEDFRVELPCEKIRRIEYYYGIKFGSMTNANLPTWSILSNILPKNHRAAGTLKLSNRHKRPPPNTFTFHPPYNYESLE